MHPLTLTRIPGCPILFNSSTYFHSSLVVFLDKKGQAEKKKKKKKGKKKGKKDAHVNQPPLAGLVGVSFFLLTLNHPQKLLLKAWPLAFWAEDSLFFLRVSLIRLVYYSLAILLSADRVCPSFLRHPPLYSYCIVYS